MEDDETTANDTPTRREYVKYGGAVIGGALLAGCSGGARTETAEPADQETATATPTETATETTTDTPTNTAAETSTDRAYSVEIAPAGEVTFESVPETWVAENASWADMGVALGLEKPSAVVLTGEYRTWHYEEIPGLSTSKDEMTSLWQDGISKELLYDIDAGVHFIDPNYMVELIPNWDRSDVQEISGSVGPFCGNTSFSTYPWHEDYPYFDLYEATEKVAAVFQRTDRFEALKTLHDETIAGIRDRLPPADERPAIGFLSPASTEPTQFYPYRLGETTAYKHWHDLDVDDAFAGSDIQSFTSDRGSIDFEPLVEIDPEVLMFYTDTHRPRNEFRETYLSFLQEDNVASQLTAVQNGAVYPAGGMYQGPIINLAKTERAAKQLYPDEFDADEQLFDRQRIAAIRNGDL
ncbi:ABC transporter substrate-binding protein [Halorhabdus amylolytica]|uniref:ABC transporter substrate-binding protein n=1 Tax=Halorhabdus amylolytica TaxID=2559573 RepID=UPI0010AABC8B|nr:ABC transporter substrate-binding protein [Halorhabdus amylolytica]